MGIVTLQLAENESRGLLAPCLLPELPQLASVFVTLAWTYIKGKARSLPFTCTSPLLSVSVSVSLHTRTHTHTGRKECAEIAKKWQKLPLGHESAFPAKKEKNTGL